ncbi:MAG: protein translocase subunit SecD [Terriglobia bacterium]|jgi:preprotein translocase subunit SecD
MEFKIRNRVIFIGLVVVASILGIIGFPKNIQELKENVRSRIHLGLDLKGGTHLVLQVHVEDAVNITADQGLERLTDELKAKNIPFADVQKADDTKVQPPVHRILMKGIPQERTSDLQTLAGEQFSDWDLSRVPGDATGWMLSLKTTSAANIRNQALMQSMSTITNRVNQYGVAEPNIAEYGGQGDFELVVELPQVDDPTRVRDIMQSQALLELKLVQDGPFPSREAGLAAHGGVLPPDTQLLQGQASQSGGETWYIVNRVAAVTGRDLTGAEPSHDANGQPDVTFTLSRDGASRFGRVTGANVGKLLAVVLDNRVYEAANIESQITERGEIRGGFTPQKAQDLALVLRSGALPASITTLSDETVGPSLGADSIRHGIVACIVGFAAVMAFMLIYYRGAGVNADLALLLNLVILIAALGWIDATLTLPGIAGVILTVGMGVDSNVLIFERIREELRLGKAVGAAVAGGFEHAFVTIIDTHVTTIVSAAILFTFGTGPIRGFAVTLTIGLLANLFTSVFVSRVIFDYVLSRREKGAVLSI